MIESLTFTDLTISMIPSGTRTAIRSRCIHTYGFLVAIMNTSHALVIVVTPLSVSLETGFTAAGVLGQEAARQKTIFAKHFE